MIFDTKNDGEESKVQQSYQPPAIVYEGVISTRAGSTTGGGLLPDPDKDTDLFGTDDK